MPWRTRYISSRRHPIGVGLYLFTLVLGVFFLTDVIESTPITMVIGTGWQIAWEAQLTAGGAFAIIGVVWPWSLDEATSLESVGAFLCGTGLLTYAAAIVQVVGFSSPAWIILAILAVSSLCRVVQIWWGKRRITELALAMREHRDRVDGRPR